MKSTEKFDLGAECMVKSADKFLSQISHYCYV